jgi:hypothetical protein
MNQIGQISNSNKSEMDKTAQNKYAVETNQAHLFRTTAQSSDVATMEEVMRTNKADLGMYSVMWAEEYDSARWYKARAEYLQQKVWEMEAKEKEAKGEMSEDSEDSEDDDFDHSDSCDCCVKGWSKANEFGRCTCRCACRKLLRNCRYECKEWAEECRLSAEKCRLSAEKKSE